MVTLNRIAIRNAIVCLGCLLAFDSVVWADVTARVDRPSVDLNESFILELSVDTNIELEPDLSELDANFYRGQLSQLSNTTIINGQIRRSRTWSIALMAKSTGQQEIPAIAIGNERSNPVSIRVNEPTHAPPGEADVFITSEVDLSEAYVQSQILYRYKVYRAVPTRQEGRRDPVFTGSEVLVERAGDERSYEAILNGKAYNVIERVLAIYPQSSGEISISPARFEARVLRDRRITGRKVFESDGHTINVLPIPAPPAEFPDAKWLPARDVQLRQEWSREPDRIAAGEPVTRKVTVSALGQIETQIPAVEAPQIDGMNVYADKPDLSRDYEAEGILGVRRDQYAMIGTRGGSVEIPELEVPWWNVVTKEWQVARLPAQSIRIDAPIAAAPTETVAEAVVAETTSAEASPSDLPDSFWKPLSQLVGGLWIATLIAWWWCSRERRQEPKEPVPAPVYKQQAKFIKAAKKAAIANDMTGARASLLQWGRLQWPLDAPRSVGDLARRLSSPLSEEIEALSATSYGNGRDEWDGSALAAALKSINVLAEDVKTESDAMLPPLLPPGIAPSGERR